MDLIDENDGKEQESTGQEPDVQAAADETLADSAAAGEPSAEAGEGSGQDAEPEATPEEDEKERADGPLSLDFMDIFESEDMVEPSIAIPGLQNLTMSEVASQTESTLEDVKSRFAS